MAYAVGDSKFQGLAMLSASNALGVAWLLGQHKEAMGLRVVDEINLWNCEKDGRAPRLCLYLHIGDAEWQGNPHQRDTR